MKLYLSRWGLLVGSFGMGMFLFGCGDAGGFGCTASIEPGIVAAIVDVQTQRPAADGATATLTDGTYTETMQPGVTNGTVPLIDYRGAFERPGTYTLRVTKPGYTAFERSGIVVTRNDCHVNTVSLRVDLVPTP